MNILISTFTFPPNQDGVAEAAASVAKAFLAQGWQVEIATQPSSIPRDSNDWNGARIFEFQISGTPYSRHPEMFCRHDGESTGALGRSRVLTHAS